ncbi:hypothetical protein CBOM_00500 [Ceraceosorus bombacis]|uniref:Uncharacterized protein n=1 Tax=Ceraceosorus bombacis TaxID=401625 RepID=A0A0N7L915_9BASI|nr:hypothetical protein CBOM_00500 [Ceraceosorus bombacis]
MSSVLLRAPAYHAELWQFLAAHENVASRITSLEIKRVNKLYHSPAPASTCDAALGNEVCALLKNFDESSLAPPDGGVDEEEKEASDARSKRVHAYREAELPLIAAISKMKHLQTFKWDFFPPVHDAQLGRPAQEPPLSSIWQALSQTTVKDVVVADLARYRRLECADTQAFDHILPIFEGDLFAQKLDKLESFEISTDAFNFEPEPFVDIPDQPDLTRLAAFLSQNASKLKSVRLLFQTDGARRPAHLSETYASELPPEERQAGEVKVDELLESLCGKLAALQELVVRDVGASEQSVEAFVQSSPNLQKLEQVPSLGVQYGPKQGVRLSTAVKQTLQRRAK